MRANSTGLGLGHGQVYPTEVIVDWELKDVVHLGSEETEARVLSSGMADARRPGCCREPWPKIHHCFGIAVISNRESVWKKRPGKQ